MHYQRLVLLILVSVPFFSYGQTTDYLVTTKNDTLRGKIKIMSFETDQVQIAADGKKKVFQAWGVRALYSGGVLYLPQKRSNQYRFMQLLKQGYLSLYGFNEPGQNNYDSRYLVKKDGTGLDLPNLSFKKAMAQYLADCDEVANQLTTGALVRKDLDKIIDLYNACIENATQKRYLTRAPKEATAAPVVNAKSLALDNLQKKVSDLPDFADKTNALDLMDDIEGKIEKGQTVPPYLIEGLKNYLGGKEQVKDALDQLLSALK